MHNQLIYELNNFKNLREKDLLEIVKTFFKEKYDFDINIRTVCDNNSIHLSLNVDNKNDFVVDFNRMNHFD